MDYLQKRGAQRVAERSHLHLLAERIVGHSVWPACEGLRWRPWLRTSLPLMATLLAVVDTRLPVGRAELTITERPLRAPDGKATLQVIRREK
jgi:hypothetical protein